MSPARGGFALIAVLWLVVVLAGLTSVGMAPSRRAAAAAENRIAQSRAEWAARGCVALLQARQEDGGAAPGSEPVAIGPTAWCSVDSFDWAERINPNAVDSVGLLRVLGDTIRVAALLDWMDADGSPRPAGAEAPWYRSRWRPEPRDAPIAAVDEIALVRGFEGTAVRELEDLFTVRGDGRVSADRAPAAVLASVSVLSLEEVERLVALRSGRPPFANVEHVAATLGLEPTIDEVRRLNRALLAGQSERSVRVHGWSELGDRTLRSRLDLSLVLTNDRLTVADLEIR